MANPTYSHYVLGLRDVKVTKLDGSAQEDLDAAQEFTVSIVVATSELEGDDVVKASISRVIKGEGKAMAGSMSTAALGIVLGGTPSTSGSTPNRVTTLSVTNVLRPPYFKLYGMAYDDELGALQILIPKAKIAGNIQFTLNTGDNWNTPGFDFNCLGDGSGVIMDIKQLETAAALPTS